MSDGLRLGIYIVTMIGAVWCILDVVRFLRLRAAFRRRAQRKVG